MTKTNRSRVPRPVWLGGQRRGAAAVTPVDRVLRTGWVLVGLITVAMVGLCVRVVVLQTHPPPLVARQRAAQTSTGVLHARRGNFLDRSGRVLATTRLAKRLFVDPKLIQNPNTFSEQVAYRLGYDPAQIERTINQHLKRRFVVIDDRLDDDRLAALGGFRLAGLATQPYPHREYPHRDLAGQLIGFVGTDGSGLEGLERMFDRRATGQAGRLRYLRDAYSRPLWVERSAYRPPVDGQSIQLSLDLIIQSIAQTHLAAACEKFKAPAGQLIVMDPHTGEILAMANYPHFDPNALAVSTPEIRRNRCVTDVYEPGSTFKPFIWAAATTAGLAHGNQVIDCTDKGVYRTARGRRIRDVHAHGRITWDEVLVKSSNIGMAIVCQQMTTKQIHAAVRTFGFGRVTGSGLPGEVAGLVRPVESWNHYSVTSVPMGQEIAVTSLQLLRAFCSIANGGYLVQPSIVVVPSSRNGDERQPIYEQVLDPRVADHTRAVLRRVVTEGTGRGADSRLYSLFGKTGTAQVADPVNGGYLHDQYISSFVAAAPLEDPQIAVVCVVHRPEMALGHHGGTVAAPAVKQVVEQTLAYLGVAPQTQPGLRSSPLVAVSPPVSMR